MIMVQKSEEYKGKHIVYPEDDSYGELEMIIDGQSVHAIKMKDDKYGSHFLPYMHYNSITELAHEIIDKVPQFSGLLHKKNR
jgi:hypothetical protein